MSATELLMEPVVVRSCAMGPMTVGGRMEDSVNRAGWREVVGVWPETKSQHARSARVLAAAWAVVWSVASRASSSVIWGGRGGGSVIVRGGREGRGREGGERKGDRRKGGRRKAYRIPVGPAVCMAWPVALVLVVHGSKRRSQDHPPHVRAVLDDRFQDLGGARDGLVEELLGAFFRQHMGVCRMHNLAAAVRTSYHIFSPLQTECICIYMYIYVERAYAGNTPDSFVERPALRNVLDDHDLQVVFPRRIQLTETVRLLLRVHGRLDFESGVQERVEDVACHEAGGACVVGQIVS